MSKKEMLRELLEKMDEKEAGMLYCFAIGVRAGSMEKAKTRRKEQKNMMYRVCERCGCSLDCGEKCDCETQSEHETYTSREREEKRNDCTVEREQRAGK